jgi:hypothetical protein
MNIFTALFTTSGRKAMRSGLNKMGHERKRIEYRWGDLDKCLFQQQIAVCRDCDDKWMRENIMMHAGLWNGRLPGRGYPADGVSLGSAAPVALLERYEALRDGMRKEGR